MSGLFSPREPGDNKRRKKKDEPEIRVFADIEISPVTAEDTWTYHVKVTIVGTEIPHTLESYGGPVDTHEIAVRDADNLAEELAAELRRRVQRDKQSLRYRKEL